MARRKRKPIPLEGEHADEPEVAGPPDDAGHVGSFTRPGDTTVVPGAPAERAPKLDWSPEEGVQEVEQEDVADERSQPDG